MEIIVNFNDVKALDCGGGFQIRVSCVVNGWCGKRDTSFKGFSAEGEKRKQKNAVAVGLLRLKEVFCLVYLFKLENFELSLFKYRRERSICKEMIENTKETVDNAKFNWG